MRTAFRLVALLVALAALSATSSSARADAFRTPPLRWQPCPDADGFECARADVPRDYANPDGPPFRLAVARLPARKPEHRIAHDLDLLRRAVGDRRLSLLGLSYGTYLGASYATLFPDSYRALVLEGALDPDRYANHPIALRAGLAGAQERALDRFMEACAADQDACSSFGGADPRAPLDALIERLATQPLSVGGRTLDGDDVRVALGGGLHTKARWGLLAKSLMAAQRGDGAALRELADGFYGRTQTGSYRPTLDQFFAVSAADQRNPRGVQRYLEAGEQLWRAAPHAHWLGGYTEHVWAPTRCAPVACSMTRSAQRTQGRPRWSSAPPMTPPPHTRMLSA
jgi:pimeloyl-ACP methyl ester carboxylesterase